MDSAEIKRMILAESDTTGIRKKIMERLNTEGGLSSDDVVEMGNAFEVMVKQKGWTFVEAYITNRANPVGLLLRDNVTPEERGAARGLMSIMQYVKQVIDTKNMIVEKANADRTGKAESAAA